MSRLEHIPSKIKTKIRNFLNHTSLGQLNHFPSPAYQSGVFVFPCADGIGLGIDGQVTERVERIQKEVSRKQTALYLTELVSWQDAFHGQTGNKSDPQLQAKSAGQAKEIDERITRGQLDALGDLEVLGQIAKHSNGRNVDRTKPSINTKTMALFQCISQH